MSATESSPTEPAPDQTVFTVRQRAALWRYLRVLGAAATDADDLTQEAFAVTLRVHQFKVK